MTGQDQRPTFKPRAASLVAAAAWLLAAAPAAVGQPAKSQPAKAQPASLEGSWSGGGRVILPSGDSERARCRASFRRQSANRFAMSAVCATPSVRVAQTAGVTRTSGNRFAGTFYNSEYGISGSIAITVNGDRLRASLTGGGGSAYFSLRR
jgi:hypothetical protein